MKKILSIICIVLMVTAFVGCSAQKATSQKSEEELKAEIKAELAAEAKMKEELKAEIKAEMDSQAPKKGGQSANQAENTVQVNSRPSLQAEKHREAYIDYDQYDLVVIDSYGMDSLQSLGYFKYTRPGAQSDSLTGRDIAFVGDVSGLTYHSGATGQDYKISDQFANKILIVTDDYSKNTSKISFKDKSGYEYSIDMFGEAEEQFETILVKGDQRQFLGTFDREAQPGERTETADFSGQSKLELSKLKNGDSIGQGLILQDKSYEKGNGTASFTLAGTVVLDGEMTYLEEFGQMTFDATNTEGIPTILIAYLDNYTDEFQPGTMLGFKNYEAVIKAFSPSQWTELKNGQSIKLKIRVKDIEYSGKYQSEGGSSAEFISIE